MRHLLACVIIIFSSPLAILSNAASSHKNLKENHPSLFDQQKYNGLTFYDFLDTSELDEPNCHNDYSDLNLGLDEGKRDIDYASWLQLGQSETYVEDPSLTSYNAHPEVGLQADSINVMSESPEKTQDVNALYQSESGQFSLSKKRRFFSPYAEELLKGKGIRHVVDVYMQHTNTPRKDAHRRVRSKLTPELERMMMSGKFDEVKEAIRIIDSFNAESKLDHKTMKLLKEHMAPYLEARGVKGRNTVSSGLRRFPQARIWELFSHNMATFYPAADLLYECYLAEDNYNRNIRENRRKQALQEM